METVYFDVTNQNVPIIFVLENERQIINAGTTIYAMPASERDRVVEYQRYSDEYDIRFIFDDNIPIVNFYSVPRVDIFAMDSRGGYLGTVGDATDLGRDFPICYIDCEKSCYLIANTGQEFLGCVHEWRKKLIPCNLLELFPTKEDAMKKYKFLDIN